MKNLLIIKQNWDALLILGLPVIITITAIVYNAITVGVYPIGV